MQQPKIASAVAFIGPAHCGKADAIYQIYHSTPADRRHGPPRLAPPRAGGEGNILFVDLAPAWLGEIAGRPLTFRLGTVPGMVFEGAARNELVAAADAFVVVIDPRPERFDATIESAENLVWSLEQAGRSIADHLLAVQLHVAGASLDGVSREALKAIVDQLPLPKEGVGLYAADPRTGAGCDLAFKDIATRKHGAIAALVDQGILEPA